MKTKKLFSAIISLFILCTTLTITVLPVGASVDPLPVLEGAVTISLNAETGELTAITNGVTSDNLGSYTYDWSGDNISSSSDKLNASSLLGKEITLAVSDSNHSNELTATITVYKVTVSRFDSGYTSEDEVSITNAYGKAGDPISISYSLEGIDEGSNILTYSGVETPPAQVTTPFETDKSGTSQYIINADDAENGVIALTATFGHSDYPQNYQMVYTLLFMPVLPIEYNGDTILLEHGYFAELRNDMGDTVVLPTPEVPGYTFGGWYSDDKFQIGPYYEIATYIGDPLIMDTETYGNGVGMHVYTFVAKFTEGTGDNNDNNGNQNNGNQNTGNNNNSSAQKEYPPIPPVNNPAAENDPAPSNTPDDTNEFTSKSGVTSSVTVTEDEGVTVEAGLNKSGSVNSESTAAAVKKAAEIAKANGEESIVITIPDGATGLSKSTIEKLVKAAGGMEITLELKSVVNGEEVGNISVPLNGETGQILTGLYFETENISDAQNYIEKRWETDILGSFETAQKGGWGDTSTLSVSLEKLGFEADEETKLYALIYDPKADKWYQVPAEIIDGNVVINTKRSGVVTIVTESVK